MSKILFAILMAAIMVLSLSIPGGAQVSPTENQKKAAEVKAKVKKLGLGERVKVKVKLYNETTYQGYVKESNEDDFVIIDKAGNPNTVKYSDVKSVGGKNLSTGAKIAIGIGIGVGATILVIVAIFASLNS